MKSKVQFECQICCTSRPKYFACFSCSFEACRFCWESFVVSRMMSPHCMQCEQPFDDQTQALMFSHSFRRGPLRRHREKYLYVHEKARLFSTHQQLTDVLDNSKNTCLQPGNDVGMLDTVRKLIKSRRRLCSFVSGMSHIPTHTYKCPTNECRGFLDALSFCIACQKETCLACMQPVLNAESHNCDDLSRDSISEIRKGCTQCPGCGMFVNRTSGCSQMWCIVCKTQFDYTSGKQTYGTVHNPHFFENRQPDFADDDCDPAVRDREIRNWLCNNQHASLQHHSIANAYRAAALCNMVEIPKFIEDDEWKGVQLRVLYLMGDISELHFMKQLRKKDTKNTRNNIVHDILKTLVDATSDLIVLCIRDDLPVDDAVRQLIGLRRCINNAMHDISNTFDCVVPFIRDDWTLQKCKGWNKRSNVETHTFDIPVDDDTQLHQLETYKRSKLAMDYFS